MNSSLYNKLGFLGVEDKIKMLDDDLDNEMGNDCNSITNPAGQDDKESRVEKILIIKKYFADLQADYSVKERQDQLKELDNVHQQLRELFKSGIKE